tara:strand:- start:342 stop:803 length:462 start_codon:yes stop_codon:yes gene_type:complete
MIYKIDYADPKHPQITDLLRQSQMLMDELFPDEANNYLEVESLLDERVHFFAAQKKNTRYVGCGAFVLFNDYAEIKSMFVDPDYRGQSIGDALLTYMIASLANKSVSLVKLETGTLLKSALALYQKHGFKYCDAFANYTENNYSLFMEKKLII